MNYSWIDFLTLIGSVGLFLYGMKLMSEGLQKLAGDRLHDMLSAITNNKIAAYFGGLLVAILLQSSSATVVLTASCVNSGLISLTQSLSVIFGANLGATVTTWILTILGFKWNVSFLFLPIVAIAIPFLNSSSDNRNYLGEFLLGFGILFFGLNCINIYTPSIDVLTHIYNIVLSVQSFGYLSILIFILLGVLITWLIRLSSVSFLLAMAFCSKGWISCEMACAFILGANIGTTISTLMASRTANVKARRSVLFHFLINVIGVIFAIVPLHLICKDLSYTWYMLPLFHTGFNLFVLVILIWFSGLYLKYSSVILPEREQKKDGEFKLEFISSGLIESGEIAVAQAKEETINYAKETYKMFEMIKAMIKEPLGSEKQLALCERVKQLEEDSDQAEEEIAGFLKQIDLNSLSADSELLAHSLYRIVDELESIADSIRHVAESLKSKSEQRIFFTKSLNEELRKMEELTDESLKHMLYAIEKDEINEAILNKGYNYEDEINNFRNQLRNDVFEQIDKKQVEFEQSSIFMTLIKEYEKIGDYVINILCAMPQ